MKNESSVVRQPSYEELLELYKEKEKLLNEYTLPSHPSTDGYYHVNVKAKHTISGKRQQLTAKSLEDLREKLYKVIYSSLPGSTHYTFEDVFGLWQENIKQNTLNSNRKYSVQNTLIRNQSEFKRFFKWSGTCTLFIETITKATG